MSEVVADTMGSSRIDRASRSLPPHAWFGLSAAFHYLGPSFAVLLFPVVGVLGMTWLRLGSSALMLAPVARPLRVLRGLRRGERWPVLGLGMCIAGMNCCFYQALVRLPMGLVSAIEFLGPIGLALYGMRSRRNIAALALAAAGVFVLIDVRWTADASGLAWALASASLYVLYIVFGHRIAQTGAQGGIARLGASLTVAFIAVSPFGAVQAWRAIGYPLLLAAGFGIGLSSTVIPYICDQLAMTRLTRSSFALLSSILPAVAMLVGALVLRQTPHLKDIAGIALVTVGVALHVPGDGVDAAPID